MRENSQKDFFDKIKKSNGCWEWLGFKDKKGYGRIKISGKTFKAHRLSQELFNGKIPKGLHVLHRCNNPSCVNPAHLYCGTNADNIRDKIAAGRSRNGAWAMKACAKGHAFDILKKNKAGRDRRVCSICYDLKKKRAVLLRKKIRELKRISEGREKWQRQKT